MLILKSPLLLGIFFLVVSLNAPLVAGPKPVEQGRKVENSFTSERLAAQGRRASENGGNSSQEQRGSVARIKDWDDLLNEQTSRQSGEAPKKGREHILGQIAQAAQQAYQRGDEDHPDWDRVAGLVEGLKSENVVERRLSNASEANQAEAEVLQYNFFHATLPAIKKTSVVAPLRAPNNFQAAAIMEKANEEQRAWEGARINFEEACKEQKLHPEDDSDLNNPTSNAEDAEFYSPGPFDAYLQGLNYKIDRSKIEIQLNVLHHDIMQKIIEANVCTKNFEKRALDAQEIAARYQPLLALIAAAKESADPAVQHKWEQFHQEAAARCLEDLSQVAKIKLWQNRNQVASINKVAERVQEQAERAAGVVAWEEALSAGGVAQDAWTKRKEQLQQSQQKLNEQKNSLGLEISTTIEQEIARELAVAAKAMDRWIERQARLPLKIIESHMNHTSHLHEIALQQYEVENQLKRNGNPALARYNKEKYLGLASKQYGKTMLLVQELKDDVDRTLDAAWNEQIEEFQKEFTNNRLFLLIAPLIKSDEQFEQSKKATAALQAAQQESDH